jgi:hypothetical protein
MMMMMMMDDDDDDDADDDDDDDDDGDDDLRLWHTTEISNARVCISRFEAETTRVYDQHPCVTTTITDRSFYPP